MTTEKRLWAALRYKLLTHISWAALDLSQLKSFWQHCCIQAGNAACAAFCNTENERQALRTRFALSALFKMDFNLQHKYRKSQINGTIYVTTCQTLTAERLADLESGAGELFLTRIHKRSTPDHIMQVAIELGDVFMLRFKIDFSGCSRGYAYLQYIDAQHKALALEILQHRFRVARLKVQVRESRNRKTLVLNNVNHLTPLQVHQELRLVGHYIKLSVYEYQPQRYIYLILYRNNDEAALAHHMLRTRMSNFGANAFIDWLDKGQPLDKDQPVDPLPIDCCVQLPRNGHALDLEQLQNVAECGCFRI